MAVSRITGCITSLLKPNALKFNKTSFIEKKDVQCNIFVNRIRLLNTSYELLLEIHH